MVVLYLFHIEMKNLQRTKLRETHLILKLWEFQVSGVYYVHPKSTQGWSTPTVGALTMGERTGSFLSPCLKEGYLPGLAWPLLPRGHLPTFQPAPALLHLARDVAHGLEETDAPLACRAPVGCSAFSSFTLFMGFFNFHNVAFFIG